MSTTNLFLTFVFAGCALAQTAPDAIVTRIVHVHNADAHKLAEMAGHGMRLNGLDSDNTLHVIVLKGPQDVVSNCEQTIKDLDASSTQTKSGDIELTVYVIGGANKPNVLAQSAVPQDLTVVIKQLRAIFPYSDYQLLTSMLLRSSDERPAQNFGGMMSPDGGEDRSYRYDVRYEHAKKSGDGSSVHLENFQFRTQTPSDIQVTVGTDVDLKEGQKVVVGKANVDAKGTALFVVLSARIVD